MATTTVPVVFGYGPDGARCGGVRVKIPSEWNPSTFRSAVRRGRIALHGPSSRHEANAGVGYDLLTACMVRDDQGWITQDGWNVFDNADVV